MKENNKRKLLLSAVRKGDYAHAGEEEAIEMAFNLVPKDPNRTLLDVGCGLGGTAAYLQNHGWGRVSAIDKDPRMIEYVHSHYPFLQAKEGEASRVSRVFTGCTFDIIYSFNAFFTFPDQMNSLKDFFRVAKKDAKLILFDYSCRGKFLGDNPFFSRNSNYSMDFSPIDRSSFKDSLNETGWNLETEADLSKNYENWYRDLITKMASMKSLLVENYGEDTFLDLYDGYVRLHDLIIQNKIGGVLVIASRTDV